MWPMKRAEIYVPRVPVRQIFIIGLVINEAHTYESWRVVLCILERGVIFHVASWTKYFDLDTIKFSRIFYASYIVPFFILIKTKNI